MTTCFHKYTPPEGQTQVIARAQSISLIRCLFRLVKCKFTEPLYKSAWYILLSLLIFSTYALSIKREGHNLKKKKKKKKKKRKYRGCCGCCIPLRLCSQKRGIAILRLSRQPYSECLSPADISAALHLCVCVCSGASLQYSVLYLMGLAVPYVHIMFLIWVVFEIFAPILGRSGTEIPPDVVLASLITLATIILSSYFVSHTD